MFSRKHAVTIAAALSAATLASCAADEKPPAFANPNDALLSSKPDPALLGDKRPAKSLAGNDYVDVCTRLHWKLETSRHLECVEQWWYQRREKKLVALAPAECRAFVSTCEGDHPGDEGGATGWYDAASCAANPGVFDRCADWVTVADIAQCLTDYATISEARYDTLSCDTDASWLFDKSVPPSCDAYVTCW